MRQAARPDQLIERAPRDMKQLRGFIGIEQGLVKEAQELDDFPLTICLLRLAASPGRATVEALMRSAGTAGS